MDKDCSKEDFSVSERDGLFPRHKLEELNTVRLIDIRDSLILANVEEFKEIEKLITKTLNKVDKFPKRFFKNTDGNVVTFLRAERNSNTDVYGTSIEVDYDEDDEMMNVTIQKDVLLNNLTFENSSIKRHNGTRPISRQEFDEILYSATILKSAYENRDRY